MKCKCFGCNENAYARGLCIRCYQGLSRIVSRQGTTWEKLDEWGLSEPKQIKEKKITEPKEKKSVGRPSKFTDEEYRATILDYSEARQVSKITKEFLESFLDKYSSRMTEWQKEEIEKMMQPFIMEEQDKLWRENHPSENSQMSV